MRLIVTLSTELVDIIIAILDPIDILRFGFTCTQFYHITSEHRVRACLLPSFREKTLHDKVTFFENIENCVPRFWHLHPQGFTPYQGLKPLSEKRIGQVRKASFIASTLIDEGWQAHMDPEDSRRKHYPLKIIMALLHPDYKAIFFSENPDTAWTLFCSAIKFMLYFHEKILLFCLQDKAYHKQWLNHNAANPMLYNEFICLAEHYDITYPDSNWPNHLEAVLDHIVDTLKQRQFPSSEATDIHATYPRSMA